MARRIKRYDNRKLYDTEASQYVSLSDIAELVRDGETVEVVDNATGRDLTAQTLTQIILEEGKSGRAAIPSDILHQLLRRSEKAIDTGFDQIRATVDDLVEGSVGRLRRLVQGPNGRELEALRSQIQHLEKQLSTLLDEVDARESKTPEGTTEAPPTAETTAQDANLSSANPSSANLSSANPSSANPSSEDDA